MDNHHLQTEQYAELWESVNNIRNLEAKLIPIYSKQDIVYKNFSIRFVEAYTPHEVTYAGKVASPHLVLTYMFKGNLHITYGDGASTTLSQNNQYTYYLPDNDYELTYPKESFVQWVRIVVNKEFIDDVIFKMFGGNSWIKPFVVKGQRFIDRKGLVMHPKVVQCLSEIKNPPLDDALKEMYITIKILELISFNLGYDRTSNIIMVGNIPYRDMLILNKIREYLNFSYLEKQSLSGISQQFKINEFKLKKGFKALFGTTVFNYINDLKMKKAKDLFDEGLNVSEVSIILGYTYPQHFSAAFKRKFGNSPKEYTSKSNLA